MTEDTQELPQPVSEPEAGTRELKFKDSLPDWLIRGFFFLVFLYFGTAKFKGGPDAPWVVLFNQLGLGQWLRFFTGALEAVSGFLVLVPAAVEIGLAVLIAIMFCALIATFFILHQPSDAFVPFALLCGMIAFWLHRRRV